MKKLTSPIDLIKKSVDIFTKKENFLVFIKIYLPTGILSLILVTATVVPFINSYFSTFPMSLILDFYNIFYILVEAFISLAGIVVIIRLIDGGSILPNFVYKEAYSIFWKYALFTIVLYLIYLAGIILLIIPLFVFITWFVFSKFIFVEDKLGIKDSLAKSKSLVKGNFWKILGRVFVFGVFTIISQIILSALPYGLGTIVLSLIGALFMLPYFLLYRELKE